MLPDGRDKLRESRSSYGINSNTSRKVEVPSTKSYDFIFLLSLLFNYDGIAKLVIKIHASPYLISHVSIFYEMLNSSGHRFDSIKHCQEELV